MKAATKAHQSISLTSKSLESFPILDILVLVRAYDKNPSLSVRLHGCLHAGMVESEELQIHEHV